MKSDGTVEHGCRGGLVAVGQHLGVGHGGGGPSARDLEHQVAQQSLTSLPTLIQELRDSQYRGLKILGGFPEFG